MDGSQAKSYYMDIKKIMSVLGSCLCKALIGMHVFIGCDSVSTLAGRGKIASLNILKKNSDLQCMFTEIRKDWTVSPSLNERLEAFTC